MTDVTGDHQPKDTLAAVDLFLVEKALAETFKLVLLEIKQKASQKLSMTPILIGLPAKDDPSPWLKAGFDDVIQLPFHKELLATRLEVWLRIREESRLGLRTLYENATLGLYRTTPNGEILLANPALVAMLGYDSLKELQKRNLETEGFEPGYDRTAFRHRLEREGVIRGLEAVWHRKDGSAIYIRESARAIRDASGNILFYEGTVEDITERKRAEEKLKESERMFRDLYENAPNAYFSVGIDGHIRRCNHQAGELLGYPVDQLVGRPVLDLYADTPCGKAKAKQVLKRFKAGEVVQNEELQMQKADGTPIWISLTVNAIKDGQGRVVESRSMAVDITERKRVEERVKRRDALLTAVSFSAGRLLAATSWKDMATEVLAQVGNATEVSRIYLFENHRDPSGTFLTSQRFEWVNEGITPQIDSPELQNFPWIEAGFGRWCELMEKGDYVCGLVKDFPRSERVVLEAQDIKSILALPITVEKRFWGFIGFDECNFEREWSPTEINVLFTLTGLFGSA
ncbi:MAG: PAS domain S-box protein, partial [Fidelibacterota bacterium]